MLWIIAILVAAILVTLLGAWHVVPGIFVGIVGFVLWIFLASMAGQVFGGWGFWIVFTLPLVLVFGYGIVETLRGNIDMWGNPKK